MKKIITGVVAAALAVSMFAGCSSEKLYTAGTYTGEAQGFGGKVSVTITTDAKKITKVEGAFMILAFILYYGYVLLF